MLELVTLGYYLSITYQKRKNTEAEQIVAPSVHRPIIPFDRRSNASSKPSIAVRPTISIQEAREDEEEDEKEIDKKSSTTSLHSNTSVPKRKITAYIPPGFELPCACRVHPITSVITRMSPFCPEHGYMVRRNTDYYWGGDNDDYDESDEEGKPNDDSDDEIAAAAKHKASKESIIA
jgi:hypothetical protein